jgi:hypothetical protein
MKNLTKKEMIRNEIVRKTKGYLKRNRIKKIEMSFNPAIMSNQLLDIESLDLFFQGKF